MKIKSIISVILVAIIAFCCSGCMFENTDTGYTANGDIVRVHFLDVGQGDSIFIELTDGKSMLIDASTAEYGEGIAKYIEDKGYSKIDYLVATHPHSDHIGGMKDVVEQLEIGEIYMPKVSTTTKTYKNLLKAIKAKGNKINTAKAGNTIYSDSSLGIDILAPNSDSYEEINDYSVVIKLIYGEKSFLFTGDAEKLSENEITADVSADVLKVGHHGSSTSSGENFIKRVNPEYAVISCGEDNSYGHPHKETIKTLKKYDVEVFRTDKMGTIIAQTDGTSLDITDGNKSIENN